MSAGAKTGDLLLKRYRLLDPQGETALWRGFLARDEGREPRDAGEREATLLVKLVRSELAHDEPSRAYVLRELTRVRLLQHPAIVRPAEILVPEEKSGLILVEPIQAGLSQGLLLHRMVAFRREEGDRFRLDEVRRIGVQLASALGYVHGQLLCHGDLRLESVLLRPEGVRLCDVGLGRALPRGPYLDAVSKAGEAHLLAPEVRTGRPPDVRSDVFGLGALYRHLVSMGEDAHWAAFQHEQPGLAAVLSRALDSDPQGRYPSVEALVADVEAVALTGAPVRRRHSPTPVALAVAAGRLPVEELSRPHEPGDPTRRRDSGEMDAVVLAPLAASTSARISFSPKAPRTVSLSGAPGVPRPQPALQDDDAQPTRQVRKTDAAELRGADPSDIGAQFTMPATLLDPAEIGRRPSGAPRRAPGRAGAALAPEGAAVLDHTVAQVKLDPDDAPTTAVPRVDEPALDHDEVHNEGPPTVKVDDADILAARAALLEDPSVALLFHELPPLLPAPDEAATGHFVPPPVSGERSRPPSGRPVSGRAATSGDGTPTRPTPVPPVRPAPSASTPRRRAALSRWTVSAALLLAAAVGALGAVLAVSLLQERPAPPEKKVEAPRPAPEKKAPKPLLPAKKGTGGGAGPSLTPAPSPGGRGETVVPPRPTAPKAAAPAVAPKPALSSGGCPSGMVPVPGAAPFCIDQHEQPGAGQRPAVGVGYKDAEAACGKLGRRLCTDAEWETACRGKGRSSYPYGHDVRDALCNTRGGALQPAGAKATCVSAAGVFDMSGNAAEWVHGGNLRGGSAQGETDGRCSKPLKLPPGGKSPFTGFRCCK